MERRRAGRLAAAALVLWAAAAGAQELSFGWQPGFPMRMGTQVLLMWNPAPGATGYLVLRRTVETGAFQSWEVPATQFIDPAAPETATYAYTVQALMPGGQPGAVSEERRLSGAVPLSPPKWSGLFQKGESVSLAWEAADKAAFYNLYRADGEGKPQLLASVQEVRFVDAKVKVGGAYTYWVRSVGVDSRESKDSDPRKITVAGAAAAAGAADVRYVEVVKAFREEPQRYRFREPTDLAQVKDQTFVTDMGSRAVVVLGPDGEFRGEVAPEPPDYPGVWGIPWGISVGPKGERMALTFMGVPRVRIFTLQGVPLYDVPLARPPGFEDRAETPQPMDVLIDKDQTFWVTDYTYAQVVHLASDGKELGRIGKPRFAKDAGPFRSPTFLERRPDGGFYLVDSLLAEVFEVDGGGQIVRRWRSDKGPAGVLSLPKGLAAAPGGELLVVDGMRSSVQAFDAEGKLKAVYFTKDKKALQLVGLVTVLVEPSGTLLALSKVDSTVYRLKVVGAPAPK